MASFREYERRSIIPLSGLLLAVYYAIVLVPLSRRAHDLDTPLQSAWQKLSTSLEQTNSIAIDFLHLTNQLTETKRAIALLDSAKQKAASRLELSAPIRAKMNAPFQNFDYQYERSRQMDELGKLAKQAQVTIDPAVLVGFPEHTADIRQEAFLWPALSFAEHLLVLAIQCKVTAIHSLEVPLTLTNEPPLIGSIPLTEIPIQVDITGSTASLLKFLENLPLRGDEVRARGLPEGRPEKTPIFIDRLVLKKQSPEKADEVRLSLRAVGYVLKEN